MRGLSEMNVTAISPEKAAEIFGDQHHSDSWRALFARLKTGEVLLVRGKKQTAIRSAAAHHKVKLSVKPVDGGFAVRFRQDVTGVPE